MAHYALLDNDNIVTTVIVGPDENLDGIDWEQHYTNLYGKTCKRTSYNTYGNAHTNGGTSFRGNYAGVGYTYDSSNDVFYAPQPVIEGKTFELNQTTWLWEEVEDE